MANCDFRIKFDPKTETQRDLIKRILYVLYIKRLKNNKPAVTFISADSGEGKSWAALSLQEILCELQGINFLQYMDAVNVYHPGEYGEKIDNLLYNQSIKEVNLICVHEARELVKAKNWQQFLAQAIADVNAMSRGIKRLCFFIISQFIRDITVDVRYTLNYYIKVSRPLGHKARLYFYVLWKDDRNLDKPMLKKRKLRGVIELPDGTQQFIKPMYFELDKPSKEVLEIFEKHDFEAKSKILKGKLKKLMKSINKDLDIEGQTIEKLIDFYSETPERLNIIGRHEKGKFRVKSDFKQTHDLSERDFKEFEYNLNQRLKNGKPN